MQNKEWFLRKQHLNNAKVLPINEHASFILDAIKYNDTGGIELAIKYNLDLNIKNINGELIWFDLAVQAHDINNIFANRALMLLSKANCDIIYQKNYIGKNLFETALCIKVDWYITSYDQCHYDKPLAKFFYQRYLKDLQNFKFHGDLEQFAKLAVGLNEDVKALKIIQLNGLSDEKTAKIAHEKYGDKYKLSAIEEAINNEIHDKLNKIQEDVIKLENAQAIATTKFFSWYNLRNKLVEEINAKSEVEIKKEDFPTKEDFSKLDQLIDEFGHIIFFGDIN